MEVFLHLAFIICALGSVGRGAAEEEEVRISPHVKPYIKRNQLKVIVWSRESCYYQEVTQGLQVIIKYQVMDEDKEIRYIEKNLDGGIVYWADKSTGERSIDATEAGVYEFCFANMARSSLAVNILVISIDLNLRRQLYGEVDEVPMEYRDMWNATIGLASDMNTIHNQLFERRRWGYFDLKLVEDNGRFVTFWSLAQCGVVLLAGMIQVYALRTMFRTVAVTPTNKPRS